jgi:hypothetical protein
MMVRACLALAFCKAHSEADSSVAAKMGAAVRVAKTVVY